MRRATIQDLALGCSTFDGGGFGPGGSGNFNHGWTRMVWREFFLV